VKPEGTPFATVVNCRKPVLEILRCAQVDFCENKQAYPFSTANSCTFDFGGSALYE
jgi:hypothetical protein